MQPRTPGHEANREHASAHERLYACPVAADLDEREASVAAVPRFVDAVRDSSRGTEPVDDDLRDLVRLVQSDETLD